LRPQSTTERRSCKGNGPLELAHRPRPVERPPRKGNGLHGRQSHRPRARAAGHGRSDRAESPPGPCPAAHLECTLPGSARRAQRAGTNLRRAARPKARSPTRSSAEESMTNVAFHLPHLDAGGIERVVLNVLLHLDRSRFRPTLVLRRKEGLLLRFVPGDVEILALGGRRALFSVRALARRLRQSRAQVVYSGTNAANLATIAAASVAGSKIAVVASEHTPPGIFLEEAKFPRIRRAAMRLLYPRAATIAVPLDEVGEELRRVLGLPELPITVLPNPVISETVHRLKDETPEIALPDDGAPLLVASGRLVEAKGYDVLLAALAALSGLKPPPRLIVLGEGPKRAELESLARSLGVAPRVTFAGTVSNPYAIMSRADAFVQSSRREGFGNVLIEAMACGTPVVAADCPVGPRRILGENGAGILVPPEAPRALAAALERLLADRDLARRLAAAGREKAAEYDVSAAVPRFEKLFEEVAGS